MYAPSPAMRHHRSNEMVWSKPTGENATPITPPGTVSFGPPSSYAPHSASQHTFASTPSRSSLSYMPRVQVHPPGTRALQCLSTEWKRNVDCVGNEDNVCVISSRYYLQTKVSKCRRRLLVKVLTLWRKDLVSLIGCKFIAALPE